MAFKSIFGQAKRERIYERQGQRDPGGIRTDIAYLMFYDLSKDFDSQKAKERFFFLMSKKCVVEIKEKKERRTIRQNSYLHLLFSWFGIHTGYTAEEVKQEIFKKIVNPEIFYEGEFGALVKIERWRSTSDLDTSEMTLAIDRFRDYASKVAGIYLPEPTDLAFLKEMEIEVENQKQYL